MEKAWRLNDNANGIYSNFCMDDEEDADAAEVVDRVLCSKEHVANGNGTLDSPKLVPHPFLSPNSPPHLGFIEHPVSKFDTLAGVAIKYGVEVADIKKMNGLVTDLQMFGLKYLQIPLPGRHPPSTCLSNGSDSPGLSSCENSTQRKVSAAMSSLQGYYGLPPTDRKPKSASFDMGTTDHLENGTLARYSSLINSPLTRPRKSRSYGNGLVEENGEPLNSLPIADSGEVESDKRREKVIRRRQKSEADFNCRTPEKLLREESVSSSSSLISPITGKGLAQRPKSGNRITLGADSEAGGLVNMAVTSGDQYADDGLDRVQKSSSASSLQDQENGGASIWSASKLKLKSDLQALSTAAIAIPIFDGLTPITGRKSKAAID